MAKAHFNQDTKKWEVPAGGKAWKDRKENKWIVNDKGTVTGLVHPATEEEAKAEMERLGLTGTVHARSRFEAGKVAKGILLRDTRANKQAAIRSYAQERLGASHQLIRTLVANGMELPPAIASFVDYGSSKVEWCDKATQDELDAYDPYKDKSWPKIA
jgi:hypothetical protein